MRVKLINAVSLPHPHNPKRTVLHTAGEVLEMDDEIAQRALDMGAAEEVESDEEADNVNAETGQGPAPENGERPAVTAGDTPGSETPEAPEEVDDLPERPSNAASGKDWRAYLLQLEEATRDELGPLVVPDDARRDDMIRIGDERVKAWNEEG